MSNETRVDRLERKNPPDRVPTSREFQAEIDIMEADPEYIPPWTRRQVDVWIEQMRESILQNIDQVKRTHPDTYEARVAAIMDSHADCCPDLATMTND